MAEQPNTPKTEIRQFAERLLRRPLTPAQWQVLEAYLDGTPDSFARASLKSLDQVLGQTAGLIEGDRQRTQALIQATRPEGAPQREERLKQAMAATEARRQGVLDALDASPAKAWLTDLIQQEVRRALEGRMEELVRQVEAVLARLNKGDAGR